jgi:prepilin-type N-terminal cleavage/methylation domain-containing protein
MSMNFKLKQAKGVTLIELLIALAISGILMGALYQAYIGQQKTYTVQEQVVDMQQNTRVAIGRMMREIRMAGFGNVSYVLGLTGGVNTFTQAITPNINAITLVGGFTQVSTLTADAAKGQSQVTLASAADANQFDTVKKRFISIGGTESNTVSSINGAVLALVNPLQRPHNRTDALGNALSIPIFKIQAITYSVVQCGGKWLLLRDDNTEGGLPCTDPNGDTRILADNIENLQFKYYDSSDAEILPPIADPTKIAKITLTVTARTKDSDPELKGGVGEEAGGRYRRRVIYSNIQLRNMGLPQP